MLKTCLMFIKITGYKIADVSTLFAQAGQVSKKRKL